MKNKYLLYITFLVQALLISSCKNQDLETSATIRYGTSFGMCVDYCKKELSINGYSANYVKSKHGNNPEAKKCNQNLAEATLTSLRNSIDSNVFDKLPDVIGCPDCADGGAEYVEITNNGKTRRVTFEYGKTPIQLKDVVDKLKPIFQSFNDCN